MRTLLLVAILLLQAVCACGGDDGALEREARRDFEAILDLWRDGRLEEVYERTTRGGTRSRESFIRTMSEGRRPACCWEKLRDVTVSVRDERHAAIAATVGIETGTGTETVTRSFDLVREDGGWKARASDLLSLAGSKKKRRGKER